MNVATEKTLNDLAAVVASIKQESQEIIDAVRSRHIRDMGLLKRQLGQDFRDLALIAAAACDKPHAQINLIDGAHQYVRMEVGAVSASIAPRDAAICNITVQHPGELTVIPNTKEDPRLIGNPFVTSDAILFYAGAPLVLDDGCALGAVCVLDRKPGTLTERQREVLQALSRVIASMLTRLR